MKGFRHWNVEGLLICCIRVYCVLPISHLSEPEWSRDQTEPELSWLLVTYCWRFQGVSTYFLKKLHVCTCPRLISYPIIWWDFPEGIFFFKMWKLSHISTYMFTNIVPLHTINKMFFRWDLYESKPDYTRLKNVFTNRATAMEQRTTRLCT